MKVTIITNYWKESDGGGVKTYLTNLFDELIKRDNIEVSVVFRQGWDYKNYHATGNKIIFSIKSFIKVIEIKPQIIHSQGAWYCLLPGYIYKKIFGVRLIHTFHTQPTEKMSQVGTIFFSTLINACDYVTFVSNSLKETNEKFGLKFSNTAITYAGVIRKDVSEEEITDFCNNFGIKGTDIILLAQAFTAHKSKAEGAKRLMQALKNLIGKYPNIRLIITRDGIFSNELKQFANLEGIYDNVIFTGDLDNPFIPLAICDIYTHITLAEGFSLALLEAMIMSKPIIATNIGGIPEAINDGVNGILVEPCKDQIVEKIEYLLEHQDYAKKIGDNAKKTVENLYTWDKTVDKLIDIYLVNNSN